MSAMAQRNAEASEAQNGVPFDASERCHGIHSALSNLRHILLMTPALLCPCCPRCLVRTSIRWECEINEHETLVHGLRPRDGKKCMRRLKR